MYLCETSSCWYYHRIAGKLSLQVFESLYIYLTDRLIMGQMVYALCELSYQRTERKQISVVCTRKSANLEAIGCRHAWQNRQALLLHVFLQVQIIACNKISVGSRGKWVRPKGVVVWGTDQMGASLGAALNDRGVITRVLRKTNSDIILFHKLTIRKYV